MDPQHRKRRVLPNTMNLFRSLNEEEVAQFKKWARDNYEPFTPIKGFWHPVIQVECARINAEAGSNVEINSGLNLGPKTER